MSTPALRHFVERALGVLAPAFEDGFPGCFDWWRLCRDAPAIVERTGGGSSDAADRTWSVQVRQRAEAIFRFAHVAALALLCASHPDEGDPEAALDRFGDEPEDEEEDRFEGLVNDVLGPLEESLLDDGVRLDERGDLARRLLDGVWPHVESMLADVEGLSDEAEDEADDENASQDAEWTVFVALARVAAILATFRWMAAYPDAEAPDVEARDVEAL